ncbi:UDP-N-acetylglucosamine--N-acetylmuramyl-(pentapeptide) pyrophosphoryl-undecaprenol N-acetylglucosamine transferase [Humidisolicoccus flavus]|uniref:UDP-N-acetylglucosamine--N-acetylmuramyl- (pentapeptide) pyrophosphoryl-undecaprenol N-acetylglucosamine transferase n=1 Tax=Humidisolicoccus flavus TaxID=3111414 RepID=UPI003256200E
MTVYLFAGGGTAGHVNPLLAVADRLREREPDSEVLVLGTKEGLERELVPTRGYELLTIAKLPFPRHPNLDALRFLPRFARAVRQVRAIIRDRGVTAVVGFGGYASAPAYVAAKRENVPLIIHEANAMPGMANKLGARSTPWLGSAYANAKFAGARHVGMPLRTEITSLDRSALRGSARAKFGLDPDRQCLLVTGGSQGARAINRAIVTAAPQIVAAGWQILHLSGGRQTDFEPATVEHYTAVTYVEHMHFALAAADFVVCRAGSLTVSELMAVGLPAVYVPLPFGNGEQGLNAADQIDAGGALLVDNSAFTPEWIQTQLIPLLRDSERVKAMARASQRSAVLDGSERMYELISEAVADGAHRSSAR